MRSESIRAISFDVGGTLIEPWPSVGHVYAEVAARFGIPDASPELLNRQFIAAWKARRGFDYSKGAWRSLVEETFRNATAASPSAECFGAIYDHFATAVPWRIFDDVLPTLDAARRRGLKLAAVSNWDERLHPLLSALRIDVWFDVLISSHDAGITKPAPEIFHRAAAELAVPASSVFHIGDSRTEDYLGATAAGLRALWLDRSGTSTEADAVTTLAACLERLNSPV